MEHALAAALQEAEKFIGATAPNPPVGAVALDAQGQILSVQAHQKAGTGHAEARVLEDCVARGIASRIHTMVVTLEPCSHVGRTPPCSEAILKFPSIRRVVFGAIDPNPRIRGRGAQLLRDAGLEVVHLDDSRCRALIGSFERWITTGKPWVTLKQAISREGSMIPPPGQTTFTGARALQYAHELRRRSDAILTGSGTVLADDPQFNVRHVPDHPGKQRLLVLLDRRGRVPRTWIENARSRGLEVLTGLELEESLEVLGSRGVLEVLVEAGPTLTAEVLKKGLWDQLVLITQGPEGQAGSQEDRIENVYRNRPENRHGHESRPNG
ncbi:MAG: bifunctional diaminohydroxyphosphoribosylaminopyrimidine deaminase/5-amino-6-(5-phosphoribosylamino)uracil reductase RibD [Bdellovibrionota bacterium]